MSRHCSTWPRRDTTSVAPPRAGAAGPAPPSPGAGGVPGSGGAATQVAGMSRRASTSGSSSTTVTRACAQAAAWAPPRAGAPHAQGALRPGARSHLRRPARLLHAGRTRGAPGRRERRPGLPPGHAQRAQLAAGQREQAADQRRAGQHHLRGRAALSARARVAPAAPRAGARGPRAPWWARWRRAATWRRD